MILKIYDLKIHVFLAAVESTVASRFKDPALNFLYLLDDLWSLFLDLPSVGQRSTICKYHKGPTFLFTIYLQSSKVGGHFFFNMLIIDPKRTLFQYRLDKG